MDKEILVSPKAVAKYCHISHPDTRFDEEGKYTIDIIVDPSDEAQKKFLTELYEATKKAFPKGKPPFKKEKDDGGNETDKFIVAFSSKFKPKIFNNSGEIIPEDIIVGRGSVVKVAYQTNLYDGFGGGMNLYLKAVQVITLKEGNGSNAKSFGFDTAEQPMETEKEDSDNVPF